MGVVEVPLAPRWWGMERGYPLPTGGRVWGGVCASSSENF